MQDFLEVRNSFCLWCYKQWEDTHYACKTIYSPCYISKYMHASKLFEYIKNCFSFICISRSIEVNRYRYRCAMICLMYESAQTCAFFSISICFILIFFFHILIFTGRSQFSRYNTFGDKGCFQHYSRCKSASKLTRQLHYF